MPISNQIPRQGPKFCQQKRRSFMMALVEKNNFSYMPREKYAMVQCTCCPKKVPGKIIQWYEFDEEVPLLMPCVSCNKWLSHFEEDSKNALNGKCIDCCEDEMK